MILNARTRGQDQHRHGGGKGPCSASRHVQGRAPLRAAAGHTHPAKEKERLTKELSKAEGFAAAQEKKLANESFVKSAPAEVVEENRDRKTDFEATVRKLQAALKRVEAAA